MVWEGTMASAKGVGERDGVRTRRAPGVRREFVASLVLGVGVLAGWAILQSGESPAPSSRSPATGSSGPRADAGLQPAPSGATPAGTQPARVAAAGSGGAEVGSEAEATVKIPKGRAAQLRALRKLGIRPTRGADGKPQLDAAPVIEALNAAGVHEGIAAFPPPGTDPPKPGIIVPEGFELPEGYVRHHQVTDDGEALPPILMLHPDYELIGEDGQPVVVPEDRVVPPELAPPGMPIERLEIPERGRSR